LSFGISLNCNAVHHWKRLFVNASKISPNQPTKLPCGT
jgi:hypothetical protein